MVTRNYKTGDQVVFSKKLIGVLVVSSLLAGAAAQAEENHPSKSINDGKSQSDEHHFPHHSFWFFGRNRKDPKHPVAAPEIDPASALSGLTLLAGGLLVIRGRRAQKLPA